MSRMERMRAFLGVLFVSFAVGVALAQSGYAPDLGVYQLQLPAGTQFVTLPLVPADPTDLLDALGPELFEADALESWDAQDSSWKTFHSQRPGALSGERRLAGQLLRVTASRPLTLRAHGTPSQESWQEQARRAPGNQYFGLVTVEPVTLSALVEQLERTGSFLFARDPLWMWDRQQAAWRRLGQAELASAIPPGAAFQMPPPRLATATSAFTAAQQWQAQTVAATGSALPAQPSPAWSAALDSEGKLVGASDYPNSGAAPASPYPLTGYRFKGTASKPTEAIATMTLPAWLLAMTNLPQQAPVRITFTSGGQPVQFELLGITPSFAVGGSNDSTTIAPPGKGAVQLAFDSEGNLLGSGKTNMAAKAGRGLDAGEARTVAGQPVSIFATERLTGTVLESGAKVSKAGPVFDVSLAIGESARAFQRWGTATSPLPSSGVVQVTPSVSRLQQIWIEYGKDIADSLNVQNGSSWMANTLPATLRTSDGKTVTSVDGGGATTAHIGFQWSRGARIPIAAVSPSSPTSVSFYPTGLVELHVSREISIQVWGDELNFSFHPPSEVFEFGIMPTATLKLSEGRGAGFELVVVPTISIRAQNFAQTDAGYWEELMLFVQPRLKTSYKFPQRAADFSLLSNIGSWFKAAFTGGTFAANGAAPTSAWGGLKDAIKSSLNLEAATINAGFASVARLNDAGGDGQHRLTLYATTKLEWAQQESTGSLAKTSEPDIVIKGGGAYEDMLVTGSGGTPKPWALEFDYSKTRTAGRVTLRKAISLSGSYQLPESWGWPADRAAGGTFSFSHESFPDGKIVNTSAFRGLDLLSLQLPIDAVPYFDVGDGNTNLSIDLTDLSVVLEATKLGTLVTRNRSVSGALFAGTVATAATTGVSSRGFLLTLTEAWKTTETVAATPVSTATGVRAFIERQFPGPSVYGPSTGAQHDTETELLFQNIGTDNWRMESLRGHWVTNGPRTFQVSMGFKPPETSTWADATGTIEKDQSDWKFTAEVGNVAIGNVNLERAYVEGEKRPNEWGFKAGGQVLWTGDSGDMKDSNLALGLDLDFGQKSAIVNGALAGPVFCGGGDAADCPVKSGSVLGSINFSSGWKTPAWDLTADCVFVPPWLDSGTATVTGRFTGSPSPRNVNFVVTGLIPPASIPGGGQVALTTLGLGYDRATKAWSYSGTGTIAIPGGVRDVGSVLQLPGNITATFTGTGKRFQMTGLFKPRIQLTILEDLKIGIDSFGFSKASPWGMGMGAAITAGGKETPCNVNYEGTKQSLMFMPPSTAVIGFSIGDGASKVGMSVTSFALELAKVNGATEYRVSGVGSVTVGGKKDPDFRGTISLRIDSYKNVTASLTQLSYGSTGTLPSFGGITVQPAGVAIFSGFKPGSSARTTSVTAAVDVILTDSAFGPLAGKKLTGAIGKDTDGNLMLQVLTNLPALTIGVPPVELPFKVELRSLVVTKNAATGQTTIGGRAILSALRPVNTIFGASGDTPFVFDTGIEVGQGRVFFSCRFTPEMNLAFSLLGASGSLKIPGILVDTAGALNLVMQLALTSPVQSVLTCTAIVEGGGKVKFSITAVPPLIIDLSPLFKLTFKDLGYAQAFPGFMAVFTNVAINVGINIFGFGVDAKNLQYVVPSSLPPVGFPFFDCLDGNLRLLGFAGRAAISLPPPNVTVNDAIQLVSGLAKGFGQDSWTPLRTFLSDKLGGSCGDPCAAGPSSSGTKPLLCGPGVGNIRLGLPIVFRPFIPASEFPTRTWWPDDSALRQDVIELNLWSGMHFVVDILPGKALADGMVTVLQIAATVAKIFSDPRNIVNLIPVDRRAGSFAMNLVGALTAAAGYAVIAPSVEMAGGSAAGLPAFDDACTLASILDDRGKSGLPPISQIVRAAADKVEPFPVSNKAISYMADSGTTYAAVVDDIWIPLRPYITATLDLMEYASPPTVNIDADKAFGLHLRKMTDEHGQLTAAERILTTADKKGSIEVMGSTATFQVTAPGVKGIMYWGSTGLGQTTTRSVTNGGTLQLVSSLDVSQRKLWSVVNARYKAPGADTEQSLGVVSQTALKDLDNESFVCSPTEGTIAGWIAEYQLDDASQSASKLDTATIERAEEFSGRGDSQGAGRRTAAADTLMRARYTDYGTTKFTGPNKEFTCVYKGALLSDVRAVLEVLGQFKGAIFDYDTSPYALGLKIWSMFHNIPALRDNVEKITTDGRTVRIQFVEPERKASLEMRIVLEDIAYYVSAQADPKDPANIASLSGATDIKEFKLDGDKLLAEPFVIAMSGDELPVRELLIFDGGKQVKEFLDNCEKQKVAMQQTDLMQFAKMGLSVQGDPMIVKSLRVEMDMRQVRATIRPKSILLSKLSNGLPLIEVTDGKVYSDIQTKGPYNDPSNYPSESGNFTTLSYQQTDSVTTVYDLHNALGSNVLIRSALVSSPSRIAGMWREMAAGQVQGTLAGTGAGVVASAQGMAAELPASPSTLKLSRNLGGLVDGKVFFNGQDRPVEFEWENSRRKVTFKYPTGKEEPGGFMANCQFGLNVAGILVANLACTGEIKFDGYFRFTGDIDLTVLGQLIYGAYYSLSSTDGLYVNFPYKVASIGKAQIEGRASASGASFTGTYKVLPGGTGIDSVLSIDTNRSPYLKIHGDIKVINYSIATLDIRIENDKLSCNWDVGIGWAGVSARLTFTYSGNFSIYAGCSVWVDLGIFGEYDWGLGVGISSNGTVSLDLGIVDVDINIATFDIDVDW